MKPYEMDPGLWPPQKNGLLKTMLRSSCGKSVCLQAVTGGGKSRVAAELFRWAITMNMRCAYYINRKLLIGQTMEEFNAKGLDYGVRAADYEDYYDESAPIQICSAPTEISRVYNKNPEKNTWEPYDCDLVVVDETHIQRAESMQKIINDHKSRGAVIIGMTATPIAVGHLYDDLVVSGTMEEYRQCKSIVPARVYSFGFPELHKVKRNVSGEYMMGDKEKRVYTQSIVGDVYSQWKDKNPDRRPTMLFAPGKPESVWFTEMFESKGVPWAHIDATDAVVDGIRSKLTLSLWNEIKERYNDGSIAGVSSRTRVLCILFRPRPTSVAR